MRRIIYDVAATADGRIADAGGGIDGFVQEGDHVRAWQDRLAGYDTVLMGRRTYEFGYRWGLKPGERAWPHLQHIVFSRTLELPQGSAVRLIAQDAASFVRGLRAQDGGDIWLAGGSVLAGSLMAAGLIDRLILKVNPLVVGDGLPLFAEPAVARLRLSTVERYESGVMLMAWDVLRGSS